MTRVMTVSDYDWYWANGAEIDDAVVSALEWYNSVNDEPANFVQLCSEDFKRLGLNGALKGVTVFKRKLCGEKGNIMVGRMTC